MKKLLWVLILLLLPLTALAEDAESRRDGAFFYQIADGEAVLTGCDWDAMQADSLYMFAEPPVSLEIPATLGGYPVTAIGGWLFSSLDVCPVDAPFEVVFPEGLRALDADTFAECFYAVKVTLPATLEVIPEGCFNQIEAEIDFPNGNPRYSCENGFLIDNTTQTLLHNPAIENSNVHFVKEDTYDFHLENTLDMKVLMKKFKLNSKAAQSVELNVSNTDRAFGAIFGSEITRKYGNTLPDDVYTAHCVGAGGQSFGAFIPNGLTLDLVGDCNDYMGKGLSGGKIVVRPPKGITFKPEENIITGNVALYGATSGKAYISGVAGERFAVRNSGATAVVEGVGDHGCEYMTGGTVVVLGQTGKNFAAGMTGGIAYVLDENWDFYQRVNKETVSLEPVEHKYDVATLKELIRAHVEATGSPRGKEILDNFSEFLPKFKKVLPYDYDRMLRVIASVEERGLDGEQAQIEAFYTVQKKK